MKYCSSPLTTWIKHVKHEIGYIKKPSGIRTLDPYNDFTTKSHIIPTACDRCTGITGDGGLLLKGMFQHSDHV